MSYRSDVVGSLLRPDYLKEARQKRASGELSHAEYKKIEDRAVDEAVKLQIESGLDVITDGEMRRYAFFGHLIDATEGYDKFGGWAIPFPQFGHIRGVLQRGRSRSQIGQALHAGAVSGSH